MIQIVPIDANDQIIEVELETGTFYVGLSWNQTGRFWTMSLRDLSGELMSSSLPVVPRWALLAQVRKAWHPPGEFGVWLKDGATLDRGAFVRGDAVLVYFHAADLAVAA